MPDTMHVFDFDGVVLDSNRAKSAAFRMAAMPYGDEAADAMVAFHQSAGSLSRRGRWEHFFRHILQRAPEEGELERVIDDCSAHVLMGSRNAEKIAGVESFLASLEGRAVLVSGVETTELRGLVEGHGLTRYFAGIYGGPQRKSAVIKRLVRQGVITLPAVYYGDTEDDYEAATSAGLDFVFVSGATEFAGWREFVAEKGVRAIQDFTVLLRELPPAPKGEKERVRVDRDGFAVVRGERVYLGRSLAGIEVRA